MRIEAPGDIDHLGMTPEERSRILGGDYGPLRREKMPKCRRGDVRVLSWTRRSHTVDNEGRVFVTKPEPTLSITVTRIKRRARGGWSISFEVLRREAPLYLLQGSPLGRSQKRESLSDEQARGYTRDPRRAVPGADDVVPLDYQNVLVTRSKARFAEHQQADNAEGRARDDVKRLNARLRAITIQSVRMGVDPVQTLAAIERKIVELEADVQKAA